MAFVKETSTTSIDDSVSGALSVTGLITASSGIKVGSGSDNQIIYASDGGETITLDNSDNVTILGNLTVTGGNIISSSATAITLSGANATIAGNLTVTGNTILFGNGEQITNTVNDKLYFVAPETTIFAVGYDRSAFLNILSHAGNDAKISFSEGGPGAAWTIGHDASESDEFCFMSGTETIDKATAKMKLESDGDLVIAGDFTANGGEATISGVEGEDASLVLKGDEGDDAGDEWQVLVKESNQHLIIGNDLASAGNYTPLLEITPHATAASSLVQITGDLEVNGGRLTFGNDEYIQNEVDSVLRVVSATTVIEGKLKVEAASGNTELRINAPSSGGDSKILFQEATVNNWYAGSYGSDNTFHIGTGSAVATNTMLKLSTSGDLTITGGITSAGATIATRTSVNNLANDGSIPITATCVNIDANGSARTGIRFAGTGTAGQIIVVNNTGGETLTFHATPGTCLVRGMTTSLDTMESLGVYMFVSDGSLWNLIGGGSLPNEGLTAS